MTFFLLKSALRGSKKNRTRRRDIQKVVMEIDLLTRMKVHLETGRFLRNFRFTEAEEKLIASYPLLTRKAVIIILNVGEEGRGESESGR